MMEQVGKQPNLYLFTAEYENNEPVWPAEIVPNTLLFWGDPDESKLGGKGRYILRTNHAGVICTTKEKVVDKAHMTCAEGKLLFDFGPPFKGALINSNLNNHCRKGQLQPMLIPPPEAVSFIALSSVDDLDWRQKLIDFLKQSNLPKFQLGFRDDITLDRLIKPGDQEEPSSDYKKWYVGVAQNASHPFCGFILPRVRAVLFLVRKENGIGQIAVTTPLNEELVTMESDFANIGDYQAVILQGPHSKFPKGLYKIEVELDNTQTSRNCWNSYVKGNEQLKLDADNIYRLSVMVRFDIKTVLGNFDIINIDPVSVEEAMMVQFPELYKYLLTTALTYKKEGALPEKEASGFKAFAKHWAIAKEKSELAAGLLGHDLSLKVETDGKGKSAVANGNKKLRNKIIWDAIDQVKLAIPVENKTAISAIDACLSAKKGFDTWGAFRTAAKNHFGKHAGTIQNQKFIKTALEQIRNEYFTVKAWSEIEDIPDFKNNTLFGKIGIPEQMAALFGKTMGVAEMATAGKAIYDHTLGFLKADEALEDSVYYLDKMCLDYFEKTGSRDWEETVTLSVMFDFGQHAILPKHEGSLRVELLDKLSGNEKHVSIVGYTCNIGSAAYNKALAQRRCDAIRQWLVDHGVDESRITAVGNGITDQFAKNATEDGRRQNRRSVAQFTEARNEPAYPCREGIHNLEIMRAKSVVALSDKKEEMARLLNDGFNAVLGLMAIVPHTMMAAAAIGLLKAGKDAVVSLVNAVDEVVLNHYLAARKQDNDLKARLLAQTDGNRKLLYELYKSSIKETAQDKQRRIRMAIQLRMRAEAINGLIQLLTYAVLSAKGDGDAWELDYQNNIKDYKIQKYVEIFLLSDQWIMPLKDAGPSIAQFWRFMANKHNLDFDNAALNFCYDPETYEPLYIESAVATLHGQLDGEQMTALESSRAGRYQAALNSGTIGRMYRAAPHMEVPGLYYATTAQTPKDRHALAEFQRDFPIHCLASETLESFAKTFRTTFGDLSSDAIQATRFYFREDFNAGWTSFDKIDESHALYDDQLKDYVFSPTTELRLLVVLNPDHVKSVCPIYIQSVRFDGIDVYGPVYQDIARPLDDNLLIKGEEAFMPQKDKVYFGAVFSPFFQLGGTTFLGTKPIVGKKRLWVMGLGPYEWLNNLKEMHFGFKCVVGNNLRTEKVLPLREFGSDDTYYVSIDTDKHPGHRHFLIEDFLKSNATAVDYPKLFARGRAVVPLIRVGGDKGKKPYVSPVNAFFDDMKRHNQSASNGDAKYNYRTKERCKLFIEQFDWQAPVELIMVVSCRELELNGYTADADREQNSPLRGWKKVPCNITLEEVDDGWFDFDKDAQGPTYSSVLHYLGKMSLMRSGTGVKIAFADESTPNPVLAPVLEILKSNDKRAYEIGGWSQITRAQDQNSQRYLFAAHFKLSYTSPKGVTVASVRPFGKDKVNPVGGPEEPYFNYRIGKFNTAGTSGFNDHTVDRFFTDGTSPDYLFKFRAPDSLLAGTPWCRTNPELVRRDRNYFEQCFYETIKDETLSREQLIEWLEKQSAAREYVNMEAIKSG